MEACARFRALTLSNLKLMKPAGVRCYSVSPSTVHSTGGGGGGRSGKRAYDGLLLDAGGTLLQLAKPVAETYAAIGQKYGLSATAAEIKQGFKRAFSAQWPEKLRYEGDGRPFWKLVVSEATGCDREDYFEEVYEYYANGDAWHLPTGAFDSVIISSEVGYEKPDAKIFEAALDAINVEACKAVHVGDDEKADKSGANAVGIQCWLWGTDVKTFSEIQDRMLVPEP